MSKNKYKNFIINWFTEFKNKLIVSKYETGVFYVLNKDFLFVYPEREIVNTKLLIKNNEGEEIINPDKTFFILDNDTWLKIKNDYQNEKEIKINYEINNNKCILQIDWHIYYFYYIINDNIEEGYFKFIKHEFAGSILEKFNKLAINDFFKEMNINKTNELQTIIIKKMKYFYLKIKPKEKQIEISIDNSFKRNNNIRIDNKNNKIFNEHKNEIIGFNNKIDKPIALKETKINTHININNDSLKIYKCIYYYYQFEKEINSNANNNDLNLKLFLIDKIWLNNFKNKCDYDSFKNIIKENKERFKMKI